MRTRALLIAALIGVVWTAGATGPKQVPQTGGGSSGVTSFNTRTGAVTLLSADIPSNAANTSGNAATATALAANPTDCSANQFATAIDASGNLACAQPAVTQVTGAAPLASPSFTGTVTVGQSAVPNGAFIANGTSGSSKQLTFQSAGITRWQFFSNSTAETGSNAGSDLVLRASGDTGTTIDSPITITRAITGVIAFDRHLSVTTTGSAPAPSACGTGTPTVSGNDVKGVITTGTAATSCTLTFAVAFASTPVCVANSSTGASAIGVSSVSASSVVFSISAALSGSIYYICLQ